MGILPIASDGNAGPEADRMELPAAEKRRILNRLKRLEGQIRGLQRMIDEERPCHDVLTLLSGIRSALDATGDAVLESYLHRCTADLRDGETDIGRVLSAVRLARG